MTRVWVPRDGQRKMIEFARDKPRSLMLGRPGAGKSMAALALALEDLELWGGKILVVAPPIPANIGWRREIESWAHTASLSVRAIRAADFGFARRLDRSDPLVGRLKVADPAGVRRRLLGFPETVHTVPWHLLWHFVERCQGKSWPYTTVILDEIDFAQSHSSKMFEAANHISHELPIIRMLALSGTIAMDDPQQIWAPMMLVDGGKRLGANITTMRTWWLEPLKVDKRTKQVYSYQVDPAQLPELAKRVGQVAMSVPTPLDFEVVVNDEYVELPDEARQAYREIKRQLITVLESGTPIEAPNAAALQGKLQQIASGQVYDADKSVHVLHTEKLDRLEQLLPMLGPVVVFFWFTHEKNALLERFPHARDVREPGMVEAFSRGSVPLLLAQWRSASHGIDTLQFACRDVVVYSPPFSAAVYHQGLARVIRPGQPADSVTVHRLIADNTIDVDILFNLIPGKQALSESLLSQTYQ